MKYVLNLINTNSYHLLRTRLEGHLYALCSILNSIFIKWALLILRMKNLGSERWNDLPKYKNIMLWARIWTRSIWIPILYYILCFLYLKCVFLAKKSIHWYLYHLISQDFLASHQDEIHQEMRWNVRIKLVWDLQIPIAIEIILHNANILTG